MATLSPVPYGATHFDVLLGAGERSLGFSEVVFDPFVSAPVRPDHNPELPRTAAQASDHTGPAASAAPSLVLRRGFDGSLDLYQWWDKTRKRRPQRGRTVTVHLLHPADHTPVVTWTFSNAQPVALAYSPLQAMHGGLLMETLTLQYGKVTMK
jgi:phage tail-like protein